MSVRVEMKWEGLDDWYRYLEQTLPRIFRAAMIEALNATAKDAKEDAQRRCPVDTGALRKSIRKERHARPAGRFFYTGIRAGGAYAINPKTGLPVDYAAFVEYGTSRQRPQPFMRTAIKYAMTRKLPRHFENALSKRVETR